MSEPKTILIVDDAAENRKLLAKIIKNETNYSISLAASGEVVLKLIEKNLPDLILLDIMMPEMDGYQLASILKKNTQTKRIPIIFLTGQTDTNSKVKALESGGIDFITKPFNSRELLAIVNAQIKLKEMQDEIIEKNKLLADRELHLKTLVEKQTLKIEKITTALITALENANQMNDTDTGKHIKRVSAYAELIAAKYGCNVDFVKRIKLYASLHDVGKVSIPDALLKKPGKYTDGEFVQMQQHVVLGAKLLDNEEIDDMAKNIALYHHEKWNGTGYVNKLSGEAIPLEARIVAIADVYDALTSKRVYKNANTDEEAIKIIKAESGKHFEPRLVDIILENHAQIIEIRKALS